MITAFLPRGTQNSRIPIGDYEQIGNYPDRDPGMRKEICGSGFSAHWQVVVGLDLPGRNTDLDQLGVNSPRSQNAGRSTVAGLTARTASKIGLHSIDFRTAEVNPYRDKKIETLSQFSR
jgi:hypothetical protein